MKKEYSVIKVLKSLRKKKNIKVTKGKLIYILNFRNMGQQSIGNSTLGKLDYLVNHNKYNIIRLAPTRENIKNFKKLHEDFTNHSISAA